MLCFQRNIRFISKPLPRPLTFQPNKNELNEICSLIYETSKPEEQEMAIEEKIAFEKS